MRTALLLLAACAGPRVAPPVDSDPSAIETDAVDTPVDTAVHSDLPSPGSSLVPSGVVVCLAPERRREQAYVASALALAPEPGLGQLGGATSLVELTGDGASEVVVATGAALVVWTWTEDGLAGHVALDEPLAHGERGLSSVTPFDADDDGDLDLLVTGLGVPTRLLRNDGLGGLTDATATFGLDLLPADAAVVAASLADLDGDGDLDLFLADGAVGGRLLRRDGDRFVDATASLPAPARAGRTAGGMWIDADDDGDPDLLVVRRDGVPTDLLRNDRSRLVVDDGALGLRVPGRLAGAALGDLDGDGDDDVALSGPDGVHALLRGAGGFAPATLELGLVPAADALAWSPTLVDLDDDGRLDLVLAQGRSDEPGAPDLDDPRTTALLQVADGAFVDATDTIGLVGAHRSVAAADLDGDGWVELVARDLLGGVDVATARCGDEGWVEVRLQQPGPNRAAVGATVTVEVGGRVVHRQVRADGGLGPEVHLGLGRARVLDRLVVRWPDGVEEAWADVPARQRLLVSRADSSRERQQRAGEVVAR